MSNIHGKAYPNGPVARMRMVHLMDFCNPRKVIPAKLSVALIAVLVACLAIATASRAQTTSKSDIAEQIEELKSHDQKIRLQAAEAFRNKGSRGNAAIPILIQVLSKDVDPQVRGAAAKALGEMGREERKAAIPALIQALSKDPNPSVRRRAIESLTVMRQEATEAIPALILAFRNDSDRYVRGFAAFAIGEIGPDQAKTEIPTLTKLLTEDDSSRVLVASTLSKMGSAAVPYLLDLLTKNSHTDIRTIAAETLGRIGPEAKAAVPALIQLLKSDPDASLRASVASALGHSEPEGANSAISALASSFAADADQSHGRIFADALVEICDTARDAQRTETIDSIARTVQTLEARGFAGHAKQVRTDLGILRAMQPPWYRVLLTHIRNHSRIILIVACYLFLFATSLTLLWVSPKTLSRINGISLLSRKVKLPEWAGGGEASLAHVLIIGFFRYHPRVLDAWVLERIPTLREQFLRIPTVEQRQVHVDVPVELDGRIVPELKPEHLNVAFSHNRTSFAPEALQRLRVMSHVLRQELQCHEATKFGILSLVHDTHPAAAQLLDDAVVRDGLPDHGAQVAMVRMRGRGSQRAGSRGRRVSNALVAATLLD